MLDKGAAQCQQNMVNNSVATGVHGATAAKILPFN
jgi:hypothetical protein